MSTLNRRTILRGAGAGSLFVLTLAGCSPKSETPQKSGDKSQKAAEADKTKGQPAAGSAQKTQLPILIMFWCSTRTSALDAVNV
ncbi:hypothetical protein [Turicimonas muris]|uniref:hypothetical protein n=1 Tax=Turicimonas muris TaxID=1796652 RepID=UPI001C3EBDBC